MSIRLLLGQVSRHRRSVIIILHKRTTFELGQPNNTNQGWTSMSPTLAYVVHRTPTRVRIKVPARRLHEAYFCRVEEALLRHPGILTVDTNPLLGSVVITCRDSFDAATVQTYLAEIERLAIRSGPPLRSLPSEEQVPCLHVMPNAGGQSDRDQHGRTLPTIVTQLIVALATGRLGAQIIEWIIEGLVRGVMQGQSRSTSRPRATLPPPGHLVRTAA